MLNLVCCNDVSEIFHIRLLPRMQTPDGSIFSYLYISDHSFRKYFWMPFFLPELLLISSKPDVRIDWVDA